MLVLFLFASRTLERTKAELVLFFARVKITCLLAMVVAVKLPTSVSYVFGAAEWITTLLPVADVFPTIPTAFEFAEFK